MRYSWLLALASSRLAACGTVLWDGRFNDLSSSTDLNNWSWANQVGPYQYYIHGAGEVTDYVNLSPSYKNPADTGSSQGVKITLDSTAYWNGQTMRRTELIPQTKAAINAGKVWYHFSMMRSATNAPATTREHQVNFFESHFTEMKVGWLSGASGTSDPNLRWMANSQTQWQTEFTAGVWHNVAYEIDFSANTAAFWHSTGSDDLKLTVAAVSVSASSNGADWHLGVLELPRDGYPDADEDLYFSGVYVESGSLTTAVSGPGGSSGGGGSPSSSSSTTRASTSTTTLSTSTTRGSSTTTMSAPATTTTAGCTSPKYAQCGGINWTGCVACAAGSTCSVLNDYYHQCL
ncbi:putative carbohydrate-binding module family 1 protein [Rosellinia necatrix]|uniref:Putative carbohydrate-binding module family 1 protein n=1 Tax=Rosellinia necatrix TaxID=77044 RepID=A0A1W2TJ92_ROSNE|nr:putative carbohydrate-binding module family 1 protein [Rosellinia necatrix]